MITLEDVAKYCGVSAMTVSRVINQKDNVSEKTKKRVYEAIEKLKYQPNLIARSLATSKTNTIGVLMTRLENPLYSLMASGLTKAAASSGYDIILSTTTDVDNSIKSINTLISKQIDALVVFPMEILSQDVSAADNFEEFIKGISLFYMKFEKIAAELRKKNFPMVLIGGHLENVPSSVQVDYKTGAMMAVEYLVGKGHRYIGCLAHQKKNMGLWGERYSGFIEAMNTYGCPILPENIETCINTIESGYISMKKLLEKSRALTAVYCSNDVIAVGAVNAILSMGYKIPEDISVIGHDGGIYSEAVYPSLTTVSIQPYEIGRQAFYLVEEMMQHNCPGKEIMIPPCIIERSSVKDLTKDVV